MAGILSFLLLVPAAAGAEVDGVSLDTITELDTKIQSLEQVKIEAIIMPLYTETDLFHHRTPVTRLL